MHVDGGGDSGVPAEGPKGVGSHEISIIFKDKLVTCPGYCYLVY